MQVCINPFTTSHSALANWWQRWDKILEILQITHYYPEETRLLDPKLLDIFGPHFTRLLDPKLLDIFGPHFTRLLDPKFIGYFFWTTFYNLLTVSATSF